MEQVEDIKKNLEENGLVLSDEVADLPEMKKDGQIFTLQIPDAFTLEKLTLVLPGGEEKTYGANDVKDNGVTLPKTAQGPFSVKAKVILKKDREDVKLFEPVAWSWKIKQEDAGDSKGKPVMTGVAKRKMEKWKKAARLVTPAPMQHMQVRAKQPLAAPRRALAETQTAGLAIKETAVLKEADPAWRQSSK